MLTVQLNNIGKKFGREWIFRDLNYTIAAGQKLLISGGNGSGKSTLLQVISGFVSPNEGTLVHRLKGTIIPQDKLKGHLALASPYLQLIEDFTAPELLAHIAMSKPFRNGLNPEQVLKLSGLGASGDKLIRQFSSGMKQRLKLTIALLSDANLLLLDEPVSNLDRTAILWYHDLVRQHSEDRTVIVCSNAITDDHFFCDTELNVGDYKMKI